MPGAPSPTPGLSEETRTRDETDPGWAVIVWNDPINLMSYVVQVFRRVLGFDEPTARKHMLEVHTRGKSCVARESKEKAELYLQQLQVRGLKTTIERVR